ncbi:hypothetical protein C2S52_006837 [Perilla frutescens var. hirtella]|nr:hypothetical protein C2S52_006837 [Perilla frutescens var. hirtella]
MNSIRGSGKAADGAQRQNEFAREDLQPDNIARLWMCALDVTRTTRAHSGRNGPRMAAVHRARARRKAVMRAGPPPRCAHMADRNIVLHHGGFWRGNTYINVIEEYVHVPSGGMTYPLLFDEAVGIVGDDPNLYKYAISTLMLSADGKIIRFRIKNDSDLDHANSVLPFLRLYVETFDKAAPTQAHDNTTNRRIEAEIVHCVENFFYADDTMGVEEDNVTLDDDEERVNDETSVRSNDDNFSAEEQCRTIDQGNDETYFDDDGKEVHADEEADDLDGCCGMHRMPGPPSVSRCETDDVQDDAFEVSCGHGRQWIIPGALYQAALPLNDLGIDLSVNTRDTLCLGATFSSKDSMITSLGLYHLLNRVEYRIERSSKTQFSVLCRHKDRYTFSMRTSAQGEQWRVFQWDVPHSCQEDFCDNGQRTIASKIIAVYPGIAHGICVYHLQNNIKRWGPNVVAMFQKAANCYHTQEFEKHMRNISIASENGAYKRLLDADPIRWAWCKSPVRRYEFMTSNCAECLNGRLRWARRLPVCTLLECVRILISCWFYERRKNALGRSHPLTQYAVGEVAKSIEQGKTMTVQPISSMKFKVTSGMKHYTVDLSMRKCSCLEFDLNLIPCPHAAAAISKANQHPYAYVNSYYSTENLGKMYSAEVFPVAHPGEWNIPLEMASRVVSAPPNPRQAGRPRMSRIR